MYHLHPHAQPDNKTRLHPLLTLPAVSIPASNYTASSPLVHPIQQSPRTTSSSNDGHLQFEERMVTYEAQEFMSRPLSLGKKNQQVIGLKFRAYKKEAITATLKPAGSIYPRQDTP
ncbi:hypothetical protein ABVK25_008793 [Lepraria finkii]|uniref:Uncharacterized protein n=1 Tax=Lepraria finkii TaxID=1340010 RepID=A0ABR4AZZ5_9LECA